MDVVKGLKIRLRQILVNPYDWYLQCLQINKIKSFSGYLLFEWRPEPGIFERFSYVITWITTNYLCIPWLLHLLDNYINTSEKETLEDAAKFDKHITELEVEQNRS